MKERTVPNSEEMLKCKDYLDTKTARKLNRINRNKSRMTLPQKCFG